MSHLAKEAIGCLINFLNFFALARTYGHRPISRKAEKANAFKMVLKSVGEPLPPNRTARAQSFCGQGLGLWLIADEKGVKRVDETFMGIGLSEELSPFLFIEEHAFAAGATIDDHRCKLGMLEIMAAFRALHIVKLLNAMLELLNFFFMERFD